MRDPNNISRSEFLTACCNEGSAPRPNTPTYCSSVLSNRSCLRNEHMTGKPALRKNTPMSSTAFVCQPLPPKITKGRWAFSSSAVNFFKSCALGATCGGFAGFAIWTATFASPLKTFSGNARTTGPRRPDKAS